MRIGEGTAMKVSEAAVWQQRGGVVAPQERLLGGRRAGECYRVKWGREVEAGERMLEEAAVEAGEGMNSVWGSRTLVARH